MGKVVKTVLKVAAFAAIATFAAPVAAGIGLSAAVGATVGSAVVGAAFGAATNAVLGGNIGMGALMGGIGGGLSGFTSAGTGAGAGGGGSGAAAAGGAGAGAAAPTAALDVSGAGGLEAAAGGIDAGAAGAIGGVPSIAGGLSAATGAGAAAGAAGAPITVIGSTPVTAGVTPVAGITTGVTDAQLAAATPGNQSMTPAITPANTQSGGLSTMLPTTTQLTNMAKTVAPQLIASAVTGDQQAQIMAQQAAALKQQQQQYNNNFNLKTQYAEGLVNDANAYNPQAYGTSAAEAAQIRSGIAGVNAARAAATQAGASTGAQQAIQRQAALQGGRDAVADYWNAYGTAAGARTQTQSAGVNAIPTGSPPNVYDYTSLEQGYGKQTSDTANLISRGIAGWYGPGTGGGTDPTKQQQQGAT